MRYADLTALPTTSDEAKANILDFITVAAGNNKTEVPMDDVLALMHQQGWDLTKRMIMGVLKDNDMIKRITKDKIILQGDNEAEPGDASEREEEKSQKHVNHLARKAMKKDRGV